MNDPRRPAGRGRYLVWCIGLVRRSLGCRHEQGQLRAARRAEERAWRWLGWAAWGWSMRKTWPRGALRPNCCAVFDPRPEVAKQVSAQLGATACGHL